MMLEQFTPYINYTINIITNNPEASQGIIFCIAFFESLAIIGSILPGTLLLTPIGVMLGSGVLPLYFTLFNIFIAAFLGDFLSFLVGYFFQARIESLTWIQKNKIIFEWFKYFFQKHGALALVIGRFVGPLRSSIPLFAGLLNMQLLYFISGILPSIILWEIAYLAPGFLIGCPEIHNVLLEKLYPLLMAQKILLLCSLGIFAVSYTSCRKNIYHRMALRALQALILSVILIKMHILSPLDHVVRTFSLQLLPYSVAYWMSAIGDKFTVFTCLISYIILQFFLNPGKKRKYIGYIVIITLSTCLVPLVKIMTHLQRPELLSTDLFAGFEKYSFPSGHMTVCVAFLSYIYYILQEYSSQHAYKILLIALPSTILLALSRLSLGVHWMSDILGGVLLGGLISIVALHIHNFTKSYEHIPYRDGIFITLSILIFASLRTVFNV